MNKPFNIVIIFISIIFAPTSKGAEQIIAISDGDAPPYTYYENNKLTGITVDIVKLIFKEAELVVELRKYPFARGFKSVRTQVNTMYFPMARTKERENDFLWVGPITKHVKMKLYKLKHRDDIDIKSIGDAKQYSIGVVRGFTSHNYLNSIGFEDQKTVFPVTSLKQNIKKLLAQRVDLIVGYADNNDELIELFDLKNEEVISELFLANSASGFMAFNKDTPLVQYNLIQKTFLRLQKNQEFEKIATNYLKKTIP